MREECRGIEQACYCGVMDDASRIPSQESAAARAVALLEQARALLTEASSVLSAYTPAPEPADTASSTALSALVESVELSEKVSAVAAAVRTRASVRYRDAIVASHREAGLRQENWGRGVNEEIGAARRVTPTRAGDDIALGRVQVESLPRTFALIERGEATARAGEEIAKAVITLDDADRERVDQHLAERLPHITAAHAGRLARAKAAELDQVAALARIQREESQRRVTVRPVSDAMSRVSIDLPTAQAVAAYRALDTSATAARAAGEPRTRGQIMADQAFTRLTGLSRIEDATIEIQLVMTDQGLLSGSADTARVEGTLIPGPVARHLALGTEPGASGERFVRRLYSDPVRGSLREVDARRRRFTGADRRFIEIRDQQCRGPFCDGAIRHVHHVEGYAEGGATTIENGAGTCAALNLALEMPGWSNRIETDGAFTVTTPAGRTYATIPPPLRPGASPPSGDEWEPPPPQFDSWPDDPPEVHFTDAQWDAWIAELCAADPGGEDAPCPAPA